MRTFFLLVLFYTNSGFAQSVKNEQKEFFFKQRAIMLSQLQFEKNLDLMQLDPDTCKMPVEQSKRISVLQKNIKTLF